MKVGIDGAIIIVIFLGQLIYFYCLCKESFSYSKKYFYFISLQNSRFWLFL